jgi:glutaredoxin-like protein NrdH
VTVTVHGKPSCVQCVATYRALDKTGVPYEVVNLPDHPDLVEEFRTVGHLAAPVVTVTTDGVVTNTWSGFRPDSIAALAAEMENHHGR